MNYRTASRPYRDRLAYRGDGADLAIGQRSGRRLRVAHTLTGRTQAQPVSGMSRGKTTLST